MKRLIPRIVVSILAFTPASTFAQQAVPTSGQPTLAAPRPGRPAPVGDPFAAPPTRTPPSGGYAPGSIRREGVAPAPFPGASGAKPVPTGNPMRDPALQSLPITGDRYGAQTAAGEEPNPFNQPIGVGQPASMNPALMNPAAVASSQEIPPASSLNAMPQSAEAGGSGKPGPKQLEGPQTPSLALEKVAPTEVQVGKVAVFEIHVRNLGNITANDVVVRDEIPYGTQFVGSTPRAERTLAGELVWQLGAIKPGESSVVKCELIPTVEGEIGSVASVSFAASATSRSLSTRPELAVEVTAPGEVLIGEDATFRIKVSNPGSGIATGVVLSNQVPANLEHPAGEEIEYDIGSLKPGESKTLDLTMRASRAGASANRLVARGDGQLQVDRQTPVTVVAPALEVSLEGSRKRFLDRQATYTLNVANPGTAPAQEVELVAYLPPGLEFVGANNQGQFDRQNRTVHWLLDELPANDKGTVSLTVMPVEAGAQNLKISSKAQRGLSVERPEAITVEGVAALMFQVTDLADPIEHGGETTYEVRVVNQGSKAAGNIQIAAMLPPEMRLISADGPTRFDVSGAQVRFQELARLNPKAEAVYRLKLQCTQPGDMRVRVQLTSDEIRTPITKEESTRVFGDE
jgi:uncharacterized repeat protein (TIGR01451 family)